MYIARLTVISKSCVVSLETAGNVMELYADVVIIDNHTLDIEIDELSALRQCAIEKHLLWLFAVCTAIILHLSQTQDF